MSRQNVLLAGLLGLIGCATTEHGPGYIEETPDLTHIRIEAHVEETEDGIRGVATIVNSGSNPVKFGLAGGCATALVLFKGDQEVWDQVLTRRTGCKWLPGTVVLGAQDSLLEATAVAEPASILGDSLKEGIYSARVRLIFARMVRSPSFPGSFTTVRDSLPVVPAGEVHVRSTSSVGRGHALRPRPGLHP